MTPRRVGQRPGTVQDPLQYRVEVRLQQAPAEANYTALGKKSSKNHQISAQITYISSIKYYISTASTPPQSSLGPTLTPDLVHKQFQKAV